MSFTIADQLLRDAILVAEERGRTDMFLASLYRLRVTGHAPRAAILAALNANGLRQRYEARKTSGR